MGKMIRYRAQPRRQIESASQADIRFCWTCGSCDFECPVNAATGRLRPQKIVRMAALGMLEELLDLPEIWYCQKCRRCAQVCPNAVSPAAAIETIRRETISNGRIAWETAQHHRELFSRFQRVRWRAVSAALQGKAVEMTEARWSRWLDAAIPPPSVRVIRGNRRTAGTAFRGPIQKTHLLRCFTCGECSSTCPSACHRNVFDPRALFRMIHLGLTEELLDTPALWLCLECGRCTEACSQGVDGRRLIQALREFAVASGAVAPSFFSCLEASNRIIYSWLLDDIDERLRHAGADENDRQRRLYA